MTELLDHGFVKLIETWGSDERIIEAARMSTDKGFQGWGHPDWNCHLCGYTLSQAMWLVSETKAQRLDRPTCPNSSAHVMSYRENVGDEKLLKYLYTHKHMTPFEMAGLIIEVQAPIFVFREWHRHRSQSFNELSARYTPLPDVNYIPSVERLLLSNDANKQASAIKGATRLDARGAQAFQAALEKSYIEQQALYNLSLNMGVPKELARVMLPVGRYSRMRASANLRNWLAFLTLRMDEAAQYEIRCYANAVGDLIADVFPRTWQLFNVKGPVIS